MGTATSKLPSPERLHQMTLARVFGAAPDEFLTAQAIRNKWRSICTGRALDKKGLREAMARLGIPVTDKSRVCHVHAGFRNRLACGSWLRPLCSSVAGRDVEALLHSAGLEFRYPPPSAFEDIVMF